jgi:transposase
MVRRRRPIYSSEFRAEAVRRVRNSDESLRSIALDLGIAPASLQAWVNASRPAAETPITEDERSELRRLRKENRELRMEREILKKATAFFAKQSE